MTREKVLSLIRAYKDDDYNEADILEFAIQMYNQGIEDSVNNAKAYNDPSTYEGEPVVEYESITKLKIKDE